MFRNILAAIDFSDASTDALRWAVESFPGARVTLFHALEAVRVPGYLRRALGEATDPARDRDLDARSNLELIRTELGIEAELVVRSGWPPRETEKAAEELDADLIVVGAHTRRILPWDQPGATAAHIVEEADRPVLVWRRPPRSPDSSVPTILAALDLREGSEPVPRTAAELARHTGSRLVLVHVLAGSLQAYVRAVSTARGAQDTMRSVEKAARRETLDQVPEDLRTELEPRTVVARGRPVTQILAVAESESADVIVLGQSYVPQLARRTFLGSVTESILHGANATVLTVRTGA